MNQIKVINGTPSKCIDGVWKPLSYSELTQEFVKQQEMIAAYRANGASTSCSFCKGALSVFLKEDDHTTYVCQC